MAEFLAISSVIETVDSNITPYKNIYQVPPSHSIKITNSKVSITRYCNLTQDEKLHLNSNEEYEEALSEVLEVAVKDRLRTYKKVGSHLSGGLDSGAVVSFASKILNNQKKNLHTFSYIPPNDFYDFTSKYLMADEREYISSTSEYVSGVNSHYLSFDGEDSLSNMDEFIEILETPYKFFENSVWLKGIFQKSYDEGLGVLLNGGRGNLSVSWGPAMEYYSKLLKDFKWIQLNKEITNYSRNLDLTKRKVFSYVTKMALPNINGFSPENNEYKSHMLINPEFANSKDVFNKLKLHGIDEMKSSIPDIFEERKRHFQELFHWNATNALGTKMSLKYSLWKRDPTNDLRVIRFCLSVPENQFVQEGLDRSLIRRATKNLLPDKVRLNQKMRGVQGVDWVHRLTPRWNILIEELEKLSEDKDIFRYLNKKIVNEAICKIKEGPKSEFAIDPYYRIAMRSLIVYRFLKQVA